MLNYVLFNSNVILALKKILITPVIQVAHLNEIKKIHVKIDSLKYGIINKRSHTFHDPSGREE